MANSVKPDQMSYSVTSDLIWVYTVCLVLSVPILYRVIIIYHTIYIYCKLNISRVLYRQVLSRLQKVHKTKVAVKYKAFIVLYLS